MTPKILYLIFRVLVDPKTIVCLDRTSSYKYLSKIALSIDRANYSFIISFADEIFQHIRSKLEMPIQHIFQEENSKSFRLLEGIHLDE
jgi:hypothetical protein